MNIREFCFHLVLCPKSLALWPFSGFCHVEGTPTRVHRGGQSDRPGTQKHSYKQRALSGPCRLPGKCQERSEPIRASVASTACLSSAGKCHSISVCLPQMSLEVSHILGRPETRHTWPHSSGRHSEAVCFLSLVLEVNFWVTGAASSLPLWDTPLWSFRLSRLWFWVATEISNILFINGQVPDRLNWLLEKKKKILYKKLSVILERLALGIPLTT